MTSCGRTALYRLFAADGRLLYIGISANPDMRWGQHSITKPWWSAVEVRELEWHETRAEAEAAERTAIRSDRPVWNVVHALSDAATKRDVPPEIIKAMRLLDRAERAAAAHSQLIDAVVAALRGGLVGPTRAAKLAGWQDCTVRKYARGHGVPAAVSGPKSIAKRLQLAGVSPEVGAERQRAAEAAITGAVRRLKTCRTRVASRREELASAIKQGRRRPVASQPDA